MYHVGKAFFGSHTLIVVLLQPIEEYAPFWYYSNLFLLAKHSFRIIDICRDMRERLLYLTVPNVKSDGELPLHVIKGVCGHKKELL